MPRIYKRRINWDNLEERRKYNAELQRKRRREGLVRKIPRYGLISGYPTLLLPKPIKAKRDIFEVAVMLARVLTQYQQHGYPSPEAREALAAYRQFWEED